MNFSWTRFFRRFLKTNAFEIFKLIMLIANNSLITQFKDIHEYSSKSTQLKIIQCFFDEQNVILFAKTKYKKSMILYSLFALKIDIIILLIFSLNALKINQNKIIQKLNANINSCILNDEIIIVTFLNEIKTKIDFHILTSSKLALFNVFFKKILQDFEFCDRICLVVIDETHLMKNWFNWRSKYDRFCELRSILSRIIFLFVTSIIFEDELIAKLIKKLRFNENVKIIHESMNRKKIFFNDQNIHVAFIVNFEDLRFLIANVNQSLKKIILYEERIQTTVLDISQCSPLNPASHQILPFTINSRTSIFSHFYIVETSHLFESWFHSYLVSFIQHSIWLYTLMWWGWSMRKKHFDVLNRSKILMRWKYQGLVDGHWLMSGTVNVYQCETNVD
jgi:hypothetical protein